MTISDLDALREPADPSRGDPSDEVAVTSFPRLAETAAPSVEPEVTTTTLVLPSLYPVVADEPESAPKGGSFLPRRVGNARAARPLSPRRAKRHIERSIKRTPRERDVVVAPKSAIRRPVRSGLSVVFISGIAAVMAVPVFTNASPVEADQLPLSADSTPQQEFEVLASAEDAPKRASFDVIQPPPTFSYNYASNGGSYTTNASWKVQWPIQFSAPISAGFGYQPSRGRVHNGIDFTPGLGAPIVAISDGVVVDPPGWGALGVHVKIYYPDLGVYSIYAHMLTGSVKVSPGDTVKPGQVVGRVGNTGLSTGAHLHLEIHKNGGPIDPFAWLKENAGP